MSHRKSSRIQVPESTKNQFIGAMKASGNLRQSAELVGIKRSTTSDIWQRYKRTGSTRNLHRSGRPEKLDDRGKRAVMREVLQDRKKPFTEVAKNIPGDCYDFNQPNKLTTVSSFKSSLGRSSSF